MKIAQIKQKANDFLVINKYHPILLYAAFFSVAASIFLISLVLCLLVAKWLWVIGLLFLIIVYLMAAPLEVSQADYYMRSYNKKSAETFVFYDGFKKEYYKKAVAIRAIRTLIVLLTLPFIFPSAFFAARTAYVYEILRLNPKLKVIDVFKESNLLVKSSELSFFLTAMSFAGWWMLMIPTLGAISVYAVPYYRTAKSIFFRNEILKKEDSDKNYLADLKEHLNSILSDEIASMEKKIQSMETGHKPLPIDRNEEEPVQSYNNIKNKTFAPITPPFLQTKSTSNEKNNSADRIYMDEIGDIRGVLNAESLVDEVEIPLISTPKIALDESSYAHMHTSDMERNANESVDDFRQRVEKMRLLRDRERAFKSRTVATSTPKSQAKSKKNSFEDDEALRLALEEEESLRLAEMEAEVLNFENSKSASRISLFDDVFDSDKLDIALLDENEERETTEFEEELQDEIETVVTKTTVTTKTTTINEAKNDNTIDKSSVATPPLEGQVKQTSTGSANNNAILSNPKRLTREEILEKIRLEREKKGQK